MHLTALLHLFKSPDIIHRLILSLATQAEMTHVITQKLQYVILLSCFIFMIITGKGEQ